MNENPIECLDIPMPSGLPLASISIGMLVKEIEARGYTLDGVMTQDFQAEGGVVPEGKVVYFLAEQLPVPSPDPFYAFIAYTTTGDGPFLPWWRVFGGMLVELSTSSRVRFGARKKAA
jgi:hypothetical protein